MLKFVITLLVFMPLIDLQAQKPISFEDTLGRYFIEIKNATFNNRNQWDVNLYGPMLLVNAATREVYANYQDSANTLKYTGKLYHGKLPDDINVSNTSLRWNGRDWTMIMLPLPADRTERTILLAHELFHRSQQKLGFIAYNPDNNHLDKKNARISLRLELEALKKAIQSTSATEIHKHISHALLFRNYRRLLYPASDSTENRMELNEGVTEYAGLMVCNLDNREASRHFINSMENFIKDKSYIRSFAYQTVPVYGYLLAKQQKNWHQSVTASTDLTKYFLSAFRVSLPADISTVYNDVAGLYNSKAIFDEENKREEELTKLIASYRSKFIEWPHLDIKLEKMNISFDYRIIMPLENKGTVYPLIRVTDVWGILDVNNGALMNPEWNLLTVSIPLKMEGNKVYGDGWMLQLNDKYRVEKDVATNNYFLSEK